MSLCRCAREAKRRRLCEYIYAKASSRVMNAISSQRKEKFSAVARLFDKAECSAV